MAARTEQAQPLDSIALSGMEFWGFHGCLPEERAKGQRFLADAVLWLDLSEAGRSDILEATVNYAEVFEAVRRIVEGPPRKLLEAVAEDVAAALLREFPRILRLRVTLHKPEAPLPGAFRDVAVTLERQRQCGSAGAQESPAAGLA